MKASCLPQNVPGTNVPTSLGGAPVEFLSWVTSLTGGTQTALDGQQVAGVVTPRLYRVIIGGVVKTFALYEQDGSYVPNGTTIIAPVLANTKVFVESPEEVISPVPVSLGNITGAVTLNRATGARQTAVAIGNVTLNLTGGSDFDSLELWLSASGADRTVTFHSSVKMPVVGGTTLVIPSTQSALFRFSKTGTVWELVSLDAAISALAALLPAPPNNLGAIAAGDVTPDAANGDWQYGYLNGNITLQPPANGAEGKKLTFSVWANSADRTIALGAGIQLPAESSLSFPITVAQWRTRWITLVYTGGYWCVASVSGTYLESVD